MFKKISVFVALIVLVSSLTLTAFAAQASLLVSNPAPAVGDTITVTVSLSGCPAANTMGISVGYDKSALELTSSSQWLISGMLSNIDVTSGRGAFAADENSVDVNGNVVDLVFMVKDNSFSISSINVEVIVKSDSVTLATLTSQASLSGTGTSTSHTHIYNQTVASPEYQFAAASCTSRALYYYSCTCGAAGTDIFEAGDLAHSYSNGVCIFCGNSLDDLVTPDVEPEVDVDEEPEVDDEEEPEVEVDDEPEAEPEITETEDPESTRSTTTESSRAPETTTTTTTTPAVTTTTETTTEATTTSETASEATSESEVSKSESDAETTSQSEPEAKPSESADESTDASASTDVDKETNPIPIIIAAVAALAAAAGITVFITKKKK